MNDNMDIPEFTRLDLGVIWRLGRDLVEQCLQEGYGVTICAKVGQQHVFHSALPGTSADNDSWVHRKLRVVEHFGIASLAVQEQYGTEPRDFYRIFGLEPSRYAPAGGAVPLLVAGTLVGGLVSRVSSPSRTTTSQRLHSGGGARERVSAGPIGRLEQAHDRARKHVNAFSLRDDGL